MILIHNFRKFRHKAATFLAFRSRNSRKYQSVSGTFVTRRSRVMRQAGIQLVLVRQIIVITAQAAMNCHDENRSSIHGHYVIRRKVNRTQFWTVPAQFWWIISFLSDPSLWQSKFIQFIFYLPFYLFSFCFMFFFFHCHAKKCCNQPSTLIKNYPTAIKHVIRTRWSSKLFIPSALRPSICAPPTQ